MKRKILLSVILTAAAFFLSAVEAVRDSYSCFS